MDIVCTRCDEPWDMYHVLHEEPEEFDREGCLIRSCPACRGKPEPLRNQAERERMALIVEAAVLFRNDLDGFVGFLEDSQLI